MLALESFFHISMLTLSSLLYVVLRYIVHLTKKKKGKKSQHFFTPCPHAQKAIVLCCAFRFKKHCLRPRLLALSEKVSSLGDLRFSTLFFSFPSIKQRFLSLTLPFFKISIDKMKFEILPRSIVHHPFFFLMFFKETPAASNKLLVIPPWISILLPSSKEGPSKVTTRTIMRGPSC